ncbi:aminopeptidase [Streptomyces sp. S.PB5]|uniref:aminopeptidase n=1 Tax=Streptomyces sp. S.PB5 TaxID=3020844 RepID=UPI0025B20CB2|nr:aminopeptidase [Streptomyces sp. S.PB5]MDN3025875.1 aminopeptidase [Streptomyces sp. S.PB5]
MGIMEDFTRGIAELAVTVGANVQPGQIVVVSAEPGHLPLAREIARAAYDRGARFVDVSVFDPLLKRVRVQHAEPDTLAFVPPWLPSAVLAQGEAGAATVRITGPTRPGALDGLDPALAGRDMLPMLPERRTVINDRSINWTLVPHPSPGWAAVAHPELPPEEALARLVDELSHICRLDEPDPAAAWRERMTMLAGVGERLTERRFDAIRLRGPGTDLTVGLLPSSRWLTTAMTNRDGVGHLANLPTEELLTTPDPERVDGVVASSRPLTLAGATVDGMRIRFEGGRAVSIEADRGADVLKGYTSRDPGAARLGELALVDGLGRIGPLGTVFHETLLDENAATHLAFGWGYLAPVADPDDHARVNTSAIHVDFMIGSAEMTVEGLTDDGTAVTILDRGDWRI